jgi:parallel beta-helix repeat protein
LTSCTISGNTAGDDGAGMYVSDSLVTLTDCTVSGNFALDDGGGATFDNESTVTIRSSTISGNTANDVGGGLDPDTTLLYIYESSITGNTAADRGGGIDGDNAYIVVFESTISGNTAEDGGGGINFYYGALFMTNVTLSGNSTAGNGGGLDVDAEFASIQFATITGNSAGGIGGGIFANYAVDIRNSIVAGQSAGTDCAGTQPISDGYNIESATSCNFNATGDQQNVSGAALNLGPLNLNAPGTTQTHALGAGSAALDQIPDNTNGCGTDVTADQRGITRPQNSACDVGAYEAEAQAVPTPTAIAPTAATVIHFAAAPDPTGRIHVAWETSSEADLAGFRVERAALGASSDPAHPAGPWTAIGDLIPARGGASAGSRYTVVDVVAPGAYAYRLAVVNQAAPPTYHGAAVARVDALRAFLPWVMRR